MQRMRITLVCCDVYNHCGSRVSVWNEGSWQRERRSKRDEILGGSSQRCWSPWHLGARDDEKQRKLLLMFKGKYVFTVRRP